MHSIQLCTHTRKGIRVFSSLSVEMSSLEMSGPTGGSVIRVGGRVSALVGELGYWNGQTEDKNGKKRKRFKERLFGTVVESKSDRNWLVRWDRRGVVGEEEYSTFKLKYEGPGGI
jgi:hypothetical protein